MGSKFEDKVIISVGGSLLVPKAGVDTTFLSNLNNFIREQLEKYPHRQFFLVVGGGSTARHYRDAGETVVGHELTRDDLDWLGIHATRLNAHLVRTVFRDIAHPFIIKNYEIIRKVPERVVIASGWKPGWSTDFCATLLAEDYRVKTVINLSNIKQVYDKDPKEYPDATPIDHISWADFKKIVGEEWSPGLNAPFDPIAVKKAEAAGLQVVVMGHDFQNLSNFLDGKEFLGTVIE